MNRYGANVFPLQSLKRYYDFAYILYQISFWTCEHRPSSTGSIIFSRWRLDLSWSRWLLVEAAWRGCRGSSAFTSHGEDRQALGHQWAVLPGSPQLWQGLFYQLVPEALLYRGMPIESKAFLEPPGMCGLRLWTWLPRWKSLVQRFSVCGALNQLLYLIESKRFKSNFFFNCPNNDLGKYIKPPYPPSNGLNSITYIHLHGFLSH